MQLTNTGAPYRSIQYGEEPIDRSIVLWDFSAPLFKDAISWVLPVFAQIGNVDIMLGGGSQTSQKAHLSDVWEGSECLRSSEGLRTKR